MQEPEVAVARLGGAFADQAHDLKPDGVTRDRRAWVEGLLARGMDRLSPEDLDLLVFRAISTVGGVATFKFALSRFLAVMIEAPAYADRATSDAFVILPKLGHAKFDEWPEGQRRAILEALELWADRRLIVATSQGYDPEAKAMLDWVTARRYVRGLFLTQIFLSHESGRGEPRPEEGGVERASGRHGVSNFQPYAKPLRDPPEIHDGAGSHALVPPQAPG